MSRDADYVVRFGMRERVEHATVIVLFFVLALTGLPQKFHDAAIAKTIVNALGGIAQVRYLHRVAGVLFALLTIAHLTGPRGRGARPVGPGHGAQAEGFS